MKTSVGLRTIVYSAALYACSNALPARDLGVVGPVYPITEPDLLHVIQQRLRALHASGELTRHQQAAKKQFKAYAQRPAGKPRPRAERTRTYYVDPSRTLDHDLKDHQGRLIHAAGTRVNPFDYMSLSKSLLFFDGDDAAQTAWARALITKEPARIKPVLTNGPVLELMRAWKTRLYFDQRGTLLQRFRIEHTPALVKQDGNRLKITEYRLDRH